MALLRVENLTVQFHNQGKRKTAVDGVSFCVEPGEITGIVGSSGSGKSTIMFALKGLLGKNAIISYDYMEKPDKIGMVFQDPLSYLNPSMKIGRQIIETICMHQQISKKAAKAEAVKLLEQVGIHQGDDVLRKYPFELSGGMRQRVILAIALSMKPSLLIADEPTTALDVVVQRQILELIKNIAKENNMAVLLVSHDLHVIGTMAERVYVMQDGKIVDQGSVEEIFDTPKHPYTKELVEQMKKKSAPPKAFSEQKTVLEVNHLVKSYRKSGILKKISNTDVVRDVSFKISKGEIYGLVGESGCGKTTLAKMITGVLKPDKGDVIYHGKTGIQMVFQDPYASLNPIQKVRDIIEEPLCLHQIGTKEERRKKVEKMLHFIGLSVEDGEKYPFAFSGGERQRIGIARALILEPELIVLDEPVSALDMVIQEQILDLLKKSKEQKNISYLFISHDLRIVRQMSQQVSVMLSGRFVESGSVGQLYNDPWHPYTKKLLEASLSGELKKLRKKTKLRSDAKITETKEQTGCPYATVCAYAMECCKDALPETYVYDDRSISCFLYDPERFKNRSKNYRMVSQI